MITVEEKRENFRRWWKEYIKRYSKEFILEHLDGIVETIFNSVLNCDINIFDIDSWHYPSKGEYPEPDERDICMCLKKFGWHGSTYRTSEIGYWSGKGFVDQKANEIKDEVVAWQYIELPKEEA